ncbi:MAG: hypothetical protein K6B14_02415 [Lachnospiraceae bacterium]|nr:hypothetical protein [Lachnospiraceae bacterium]
MTVLNGVTLILDIGTILLMVGLAMVTDDLRKRGRDDDKLFFYLLFIAMLMSIADIIGYLSAGKIFYGARWQQTFGMDIFYMTFMLESIVWSYYTLVRFKWRGTSYSGGIRHLFFYLPGVVIMLVTVVNFLTGWIFSVDEADILHPGILYYPMYIIFSGYFLHGFFVIAKYRAVAVSEGRKRQVIPMWIFLLPIALGFFTKFLLRGVSLAAVCTAVTIAFMHLGSMNEISDTSLKEDAI